MGIHKFWSKSPTKLLAKRGIQSTSSEFLNAMQIFVANMYYHICYIIFIILSLLIAIVDIQIKWNYV